MKEKCPSCHLLFLPCSKQARTSSIYFTSLLPLTFSTSEDPPPYNYRSLCCQCLHHPITHKWKTAFDSLSDQAHTQKKMAVL